MTERRQNPHDGRHSVKNPLSGNSVIDKLYSSEAQSQNFPFSDNQNPADLLRNTPDTMYSKEDSLRLETFQKRDKNFSPGKGEENFRSLDSFINEQDTITSNRYPSSYHAFKSRRGDSEQSSDQNFLSPVDRAGKYQYKGSHHDRTEGSNGSLGNKVGYAQ